MDSKIELNSEITNHWLWDDPRRFQWWILILFELNKQNNKIKIGNRIIRLEQNYIAHTIRTWAALFGCTTKATTNFFEILEEENVIKREVIGKGKYSTTVIKVLKK